MKIVFMGTPQAAAVSLNRLLVDGHEIAAVYTQPDRPSGRGNRILASPVKQIANSHELRVLQPEKIRTEEAVEIFRAHGADAAVVVAYGRILPESFLNAFPGGAINLHFSLLPKYRGAAPVNWAIANGETETGATTMKMDAGLDTGPILLQRSVEIGSQESSIELLERLSRIGADLLADTLERLNDLTPKPQSDREVSYAPILKREDGRIDWSMSAFKIANRVRGFQPFPSAFTFFEGKRVTLWRAYETEGDEHEPGKISNAFGDELIVSCGGGTALRIDELQIEGRQRLVTREFLNGVKLKPGDVLGK